MGEKNNGYFFWGMVLGAAAAAIAGCVALARSFKTVATPAAPAGRGKARPKPVAGRSGATRRVRRVAAAK
jgi:hypothetical protein